MNRLKTTLLVAALWAGLAVGGYCNDLDEGIAHYEAGDIAGAEAAFTALIAAQPDNAEAIYRLGVLQLDRGDLDEAAGSFERALALDDSVSVYHQRLGEALGSLAGQAGPLKQMRMAGKIRKAFARAVELDGSNTEARFGLITFYLNAPGIAGGSEDKALEQAERIREQDPGLGHLAFANIYTSQQEHDKAAAEYRAAIDADGENRNAYLSFGIHLTDQEKYAEAIEVYERWLETHPQDMGIAYQVGRTASIAGDFLDRGRAALESYVESHTPKPDEPSLAWANYRLGLILRLQDEIALARAAFENALALDPDHKQAKKALKRLP